MSARWDARQPRLSMAGSPWCLAHLMQEVQVHGAALRHGEVLQWLALQVPEATESVQEGQAQTAFALAMKRQGTGVDERSSVVGELASVV